MVFDDVDLRLRFVSVDQMGYYNVSTLEIEDTRVGCSEWIVNQLHMSCHLIVDTVICVTNNWVDIIYCLGVGRSILEDYPMSALN